MDFLVCIDDTDTIDSIGTGTICEYIRDGLIENDLAECALITRHQLLIHEDIPYTSHNSSMCFSGRLLKGTKKDVVDMAVNKVKEYHAQGSDPGVAVAFVEEINDVSEVMDFGVKATSEILTKDMAYDLADKVNVHLSEHGGTGQGIIGALAGIGLRVSGQYGEVKGVLKKIQDVTFTVKDLIENHRIHRVMTEDGQLLNDEDEVFIEKQTKAILKDNQYTLLVQYDGQGYISIDRGAIRTLQVGNSMMNKSYTCDLFVPDVEEEKVDHIENSCFNCTYRRWEMNGISCRKSVV